MPDTAIQSPEVPATDKAIAAASVPKLSRSNPLPVDKETIRRDAHESVRKAIAAKDGTVPSEPVKTIPVEPKTEAKAPETKPVAAEPAKPETKPVEPVKVEEVNSIKTQGLDKDGNKAELEVTFAQAQSAMLRDGFPAEFVSGMDRNQLLKIGAERFVERQNNDRRWNLANEERRRLAEGKPAKPEATPVKAASLEQQVTTPVTVPAQAAQPSSFVPQAIPIPTPSLTEELNKIREAGGPEIADAIASIISKLPKPQELPNNQPHFDAFRQTTEELNSGLQKAQEELKQQKAINETLVNLTVQARFDHAFSELAQDFPQLNVDGNEGLRRDIQENARAIAQSGRFENWLEPGSFRTIVREASYARLGPLQKETNARQLIASQQQQARGQIVASPSREDAPSQALSNKDIMRRAALRAISTGSREEGRKTMDELLKTAG